MAHKFEELKHMTVAQLREIAASTHHDAVQGYTQLNKEHLLVALCKAFGLDMHAHAKVAGIDKAGIKARIHDLRKQRDDALQAHDSKRLHVIRRQMHDLKRKLHAAADKAAKE
jgi:hypothetical protein